MGEFRFLKGLLSGYREGTRRTSLRDFSGFRVQGLGFRMYGTGAGSRVNFVAGFIVLW